MPLTARMPTQARAVVAERIYLTITAPARPA
jgi:hypothetical protein